MPYRFKVRVRGTAEAVFYKADIERMARKAVYPDGGYRKLSDAEATAWFDENLWELIGDEITWELADLTWDELLGGDAAGLEAAFKKALKTMRPPEIVGQFTLDGQVVVSPDGTTGDLQ